MLDVHEITTIFCVKNGGLYIFDTPEYRKFFKSYLSNLAMYVWGLFFVEKFVVHRCDPLKCGVFYITTRPPLKKKPALSCTCREWISGTWTMWTLCTNSRFGGIYTCAEYAIVDSHQGGSSSCWQ